MRGFVPIRIPSSSFVPFCVLKDTILLPKESFPVIENSRLAATFSVLDSFTAMKLSPAVTVCFSEPCHSPAAVVTTAFTVIFVPIGSVTVTDVVSRASAVPSSSVMVITVFFSLSAGRPFPSTERAVPPPITTRTVPVSPPVSIPLHAVNARHSIAKRILTEFTYCFFISYLLVYPLLYLS